MINFRYHIVSLMAVFLALSVGIVVGVSLRPSVDQGLTTQAAQDRKQVQDLRAELDRRNNLDKYRDAYASRVAPSVTQGVLASERVTLIAMPDAPSGVVDQIAKAVPIAGGAVTRTARVDASAFDPAKAAAVDNALAAYKGPLGLNDSMSTATKIGIALSEALLSKEPAEDDALSTAVSKSLSNAGLVGINGKSTSRAQLALVVTAQASDPPVADQQSAHVQFDLALRSVAPGVVVAGPNSDGIEGTDVLAVRNDAASVDVLSTVDVADLPSGVSTAILAGKEQLLGRHGHYGALTGSTAPAPVLPVR
jgi:hypothetical protein